MYDGAALPGLCHTTQQVKHTIAIYLMSRNLSRRATIVAYVLSLSLSLSPLPYRGSIPHHVTFAVPPELQPHLEVVPKLGLVQAHASFAAQLKFLPKPSIQECADCLRFFDEGTGAYNIPVQVLIAEQASPNNYSNF